MDKVTQKLVIYTRRTIGTL